MKRINGTPQHPLMPAVEAINNLTADELRECFESGQHIALIAHNEIELAPINGKSGIVFRYLVPWRKSLVSALTNSYRRYFKLALAHPREIESVPDQWAWQAVQPAISTTLEWLRDWYILACDEENQYIQKIGSVQFVPGGTASISLTPPPPLPPPSTWRAPAWLFQVSPALGFLLLRSEHVPANDSDERLGGSHTRFLLKAARRVFLWELEASVDKVRNEEIAAAGAIPAVNGNSGRVNKRVPLRRRDKQQMVRDKLIAEIDDVAETITEFLQIMDERNIKPQLTWSGWPGSWVQAYKEPRLRKLIHQDKSRAIARARIHKR